MIGEAVLNSTILACILALLIIAETVVFTIKFPTVYRVGLADNLWHTDTNDNINIII